MRTHTRHTPTLDKTTLTARLMGPTLGPSGGPYVGPMNLAIWECRQVAIVAQRPASKQSLRYQIGKGSQLVSPWKQQFIILRACFTVEGHGYFLYRPTAQKPSAEGRRRTKTPEQRNICSPDNKIPIQVMRPTGARQDPGGPPAGSFMVAIPESVPNPMLSRAMFCL